MHPVLASYAYSTRSRTVGCGDPCAEQVDAAFLDAAAAVPGAVRTPSGLVFEELKAGLGRARACGQGVCALHRHAYRQHCI